MTTAAIQPTTGMSQTRVHHPDLPVSWNRRALTASVGTNVTSPKIAVSGPPVTAKPLSGSVISDRKRLESRAFAMTETTAENRKNHQYSARPDLPENTAYRRKTVTTAVGKFIEPPLT